jgi:activating signal cointegrator complex subunit 1
MQTAATFLAAGWDFVGETDNGTDDVWWILEGQDYPRLSFDPPHQPDHAKTYTKVWGKDGALWKPEDGTLLDFSYAGYHEGRNDFPDWEIGVNVKDFGAKGDGIADDTRAFQDAVKACPPNKVVFIPSGTYILTDWLGVKDMIGHWVRPNPKSYFALRGEGRDETVLLLGVGLQEIHPWDQTTGHGRPTTQWSWWGGFLWFQDSVEVGVEDLTIKGGGEQYGIHWAEEGYNGIAFRNVEHAWVRNVRFVNVDSGIFVRNSKYVTIENITFENTPEWPCTSDFEDNKGMSGHHAIDFGHTSSYCVADKIVLKNQFHHELGVSNGAYHCVYSNCRGPSLHFDFHTQQDDLPNNLFTEIDAGRGDLIWRNNFYGACTGAVLWNVTGEQLSLPYERPWVDHPVRVEDLKTLLVGWPIDLPDLQEKGRPWFEDIAPERLDPQNIYHAQRIRRFSLGDGVSTGTVRPRIER